MYHSMMVHGALSLSVVLTVQHGTIVTWHDHSVDDDRILVKPIWRWLLEHESSHR